MMQLQQLDGRQNRQQQVAINNDEDRIERKKRMIVGLLGEVKRLERGIRELEQGEKGSKVLRVKQQQERIKGEVMKRAIQLSMNSSQVRQRVQYIYKDKNGQQQQHPNMLIPQQPISQYPTPTQPPPTQLQIPPITTNPNPAPNQLSNTISYLNHKQTAAEQQPQKQSQLVIQIRDLKSMVQRLQNKLLKSQIQQPNIKYTGSAIISAQKHGVGQQQSKEFIRSNNNFIYGERGGMQQQQQQQNRQSIEKGIFRKRREGSKRRRQVQVGKIVNVGERGGLGNSRNRDNHHQKQQQKPQNLLIIQKLSHSRPSSASKLITRTQSQRSSQPQPLLHRKSSKPSLIKQTAFDKLNPKLFIQEKNNPRSALQQKMVLQDKQSKQQISRQLKSRRRKSLNSNKGKGGDRDNDMERRQAEHEMLEFNLSKEKYQLPSQVSQVFNSNLNIKSSMTLTKHAMQKNMPKSIQQAQLLFPLIPTLPPGPSPSTTQAQLYQLAIDLFSLLGHKDVDKQGDGLIVEKYRNCVYFGVDQERNILWHYDKGKMYFGGWRRNQKGEGEKHGQGWEFCQGKYLYSGEWREGKREGLGVLRTYAGDNEDKVKQEGVIKGGSLQNNNHSQRNSSQPTITSVYIGHFHQNRKHGQGLLLQPHNTYYHGQFHLNKKQGLGKCLTPNGNFYQGTFLNNLYQGHGTQKFINGDQYRGEYHQGKFQGKGWYRWVNGAEYEGGFSRGKRNGVGVWQHAGEVYEGEYQQDRKCGVGVYRWGNGAWYRGGFREDVRHGVGMTRYENGKLAVIEWQWGRGVRKLQEEEWPQEFRQSNSLAVNNNSSGNNNNIQPHPNKARINSVQMKNINKLSSITPQHTPSKQLLPLPKRQNPKPFPSLLQQQQSSHLQQSHTTLNLSNRRRSNNQRLIMSGQQLKQAVYQPIGRSSMTRWE